MRWISGTSPASVVLISCTSASRRSVRTLIPERIKDAKRNLRRSGKHQGGGRHFGQANGHGRARELIPDPDEQAALADIVVLRAEGKLLMAIRDTMRARGFQISHQLVANTLQRHAARRGRARYGSRMFCTTP